MIGEKDIKIVLLVLGVVFLQHFLDKPGQVVVDPNKKLYEHYEGILEREAKEKEQLKLDYEKAIEDNNRYRNEITDAVNSGDVHKLDSIGAELKRFAPR